jgi:hypothetical protein
MSRQQSFRQQRRAVVVCEIEAVRGIERADIRRLLQAQPFRYQIEIGLLRERHRQLEPTHQLQQEIMPLGRETSAI